MLSSESMKSIALALIVAACSSHHEIPDGSLDGSNVIDAAIDAPGSGGGPIVQSFDGEVGVGLTACESTGGHCDRPEMNVAANGSQVVQVTSRSVVVYSYAGAVLQTTPMTTFITGAGVTANATPIEPHIVYDEFIQRWIVTATCAFDCVMVSATSDATGAWAGIYLDNYGNDPSIHLGYDANGVYLSEVQPGTNPDAGFAGVAGVYFAIPSAEMKWTGTFAPAHKNRVANMPIDGMPSIDQNPNTPTTDAAFFVSRTCSGSCQNTSAYAFQWIVNAVTWSGTTATYGPDQLIKSSVGSTQDQWFYFTPIAAVSQLGSAVQIRPIEGHRLMNVAQAGTHVYGALGSGPCTNAATCGSQGTDANNLFFWFDLDCTTATACVVSQTGKVSDPTNHLEFATIGAATNGDLSIVAASTGATIDPTVVLWTHTGNDAANTVSAPETVIAGTQPDTCVNNPVSFASAVGISTVRDPVDPTKLWTTHQYSNSASPCTWATRIVELAP